MLSLGQVWLSKGYLCPAGLGKILGLGLTCLGPPAGARNKKKHPISLFLMLLDPALNQTVHLIQKYFTKVNVFLSHFCCISDIFSWVCYSFPKYI